MKFQTRDPVRSTRHALVVVVAITLTVALGGFVGNAAGADPVAEPPQHVVGAVEIQARIDQRIDRADADRAAIQSMLQRADVRRLAGTVGLDLERASAAAATMSGPALEQMAAQARGIDNDLIGGEGRVVLTTTAIIIILLILILLL